MMSDKRSHLWVTTLLLISLLPALAAGQGRSGSTFDNEDQKNSRDMAPLAQPPALALESTIDPTRYYVGPSDVFSVNIWTAPPLSFMLTVTPEGTLIIPTIGEIRVADLLLSDARKKVIQEIKRRFRGAVEPTFTLVSPRPIVVLVRGNVLNPGSYTLWAFNRADKAVEEANKLQISQIQKDLEEVLETMSTRNITVKHRDGSSSQVDISKYIATKDDRLNPHLREGDVIIVPRKDLERSVIGIYGEVNVPGRYEFVRGDSVKDALKIAQGFTSEAIIDSIEFFRIQAGGDSMMSRIFNGQHLIEGKIRDVALEPGDRVVVRAKSDLRADFTVKVTGEVRFPGVYPITRNNTRLSEILRKMGGFTEFASIRTAEIIRSSVKPDEIELERLLSLRGGASDDDSLYYYMETDLRLRKEIVNVDFQTLVNGEDSTQDVVLQDGDEIRVPSLQVTIYVFGQVSSPGHIPFVRGEDVDYYVRKAGGYTDRSRPGDVKVIKAKTRQWLEPEATQVEEGDYIWVPKTIDRPFGYYMAIIGQTAAIISVALSIVLLAIQLDQ